MEEIRCRFEEQAFEHIMFQDANFFVNVKRTLEFARALSAFNPEITWSGTATVDLLVRHKDVLHELGALNCAYLEIGIESGNDNSLPRFNKGTTVETNETVLSALQVAGIDIDFDFIMFDPEMTLDDLRENFRFLCRNNLLGYWPSSHLFQELKLYPATPFRDNAERLSGRPFDPHVVPKTAFRSERVAAIAFAMHVFLYAYQGDIDSRIREISSAIEDHLYGKTDTCSGEEAITAIQQGVAVTVRLKHAASQLLERLLTHAGEIFSDSAAQKGSVPLDRALLTNYLGVRI